MNQSDRRHFIVTGGASGIGRATAEHLRRWGAAVTLWDVDAAGLAAAGAALEAPTRLVDVRDAAGLRAAAAEAGAVDGVIHAAGILRTGSLVAQDPADLDDLIGVNLQGTVQVARALLPALMESRGSLILLASISAFYGPPEFAVYGATKAAVLSLAQALRLEQEPHGVHVGVVCPGFVRTPMLNAALQTRLGRRLPVDHTADDVARAIVAGIDARRFMIWPGTRPFALHVSSHLFFPLGHRIMRLLWSPGDAPAAHRPVGD